MQTRQLGGSHQLTCKKLFLARCLPTMLQASRASIQAYAVTCRRGGAAGGRAGRRGLGGLAPAAPLGAPVMGRILLAIQLAMAAGGKGVVSDASSSKRQGAVQARLGVQECLHERRRADGRFRAVGGAAAGSSPAPSPRTNRRCGRWLLQQPCNCTASLLQRASRPRTCIAARSNSAGAPGSLARAGGHH